MKELYEHKVRTSFHLWFDHTLLSVGQAYRNYSSRLYYNKDARLEGYYQPYSSPFKQWVYDSSISGASIPTGISGNGVFLPRGTSGLSIDYDNGRVLFPDSFGSSGNISGSFAIKDLNVYSVNDNEQKLIFENLYHLNSRYKNILPSGVPPYDYTLPACFLMMNNTNNVPYAFGGEQDTKTKIRAIIATDEARVLDGCISIFRDIVESNIALLSDKDSPLNELGDLKSGYNYEELAAQQDRMLFLEKVSASKIVNVAARRDSPNLKFGIIDFYLSEPRVPKRDF